MNISQTLIIVPTEASFIFLSWIFQFVILSSLKHDSKPKDSFQIKMAASMERLILQSDWNESLRYTIVSINSCISSASLADSL